MLSSEASLSKNSIADQSENDRGERCRAGVAAVSPREECPGLF